MEPVAFERPKSAEAREADTRRALTERARGLRSPVNAALVLLLGWESVAGVSHADREEMQEASVLVRGTEAERQAAHLTQVEQTMGAYPLELLRRHSYPTAERRADIERREDRHGYVRGFEAIGFSNQEIEALLRQALPKEWLSEENLLSVTLVDEPPVSMAQYHMEGDAAGVCAHGRTSGAGSHVSLYKSSIEKIPLAIRAQHVLSILIHEIAHANDPFYSATMPQGIREEAADWHARRVRSMEHAPYNREATRRFGHQVNTVRNAAHRWLGDRWADPVAGEGYVPIKYPLSITADQLWLQNFFRFQEHYAEVASILTTMVLPDAAYASDAVWEQAVANQLTLHWTGRLHPSSEREDRERVDALEYARFMRRLIPDIRTRNRNVRDALRSDALFRREGTASSPRRSVRPSS